MITCAYTYCRAAVDAGADACRVCGHPTDASKLRDPSYIASIAVDGAPDRIIDMHQILPAFDGVLEMQLAVMQRFGIERALIQSRRRNSAAIPTCGIAIGRL